jgi:nucleoside-diphosphate-sugar epimerase
LSQRKRILLTGASGVLGQAILETLDSREVVCLVYRTAVFGNNVTSIPCDITAPGLGLQRASLREICRDIDCIVHSAAITDFTKSEESVMRTNVQGTSNVLEFASLANVPFYYISTAFVRRTLPDGSVTDDNAYLRSKCVSERLVSESQLPCTIIRPSIIVGDSQSGAISRFQGFYSIIGAIYRGLLPILPAAPDALIDFIPRDIAARAIVELIDHDCVGEEMWLTSGARALTIQRLTEIGVEIARSMGHSVTVPKLIPPETFDRLVRPVFFSAFPRQLQRAFDLLRKVISCLSTGEAFPTSLPEIAERFGLSLIVDHEESFANSLRYWAVMTSHA